MNSGCTVPESHRITMISVGWIEKLDFRNLHTKEGRNKRAIKASYPGRIAQSEASREFYGISIE
jgi:hypothetical protein